MGLNEKFFKSASDTPFINTDNFNTVLYPGNNTTSRNITGVGFNPDMVWVKNRDISGENHSIGDTVRGGGKIVYPNLTLGENGFEYITPSGVADGFTITTNNNNILNNKYVAWCWKAGGAAVNGTGTNAQNITYSANPDAGFSIVKFSTNGSTSYTATHGLNQAPELVITKVTSVASNWLVYLSSLGINQYMYLNTSSQALPFSNLWNGMSSTHIGGSNAAYGGTNTFVNYCFHSVVGYQKVGSYTGGGTSDVTVHTDSNGDGTGTGAFQPRFIMTKRTDNTGNWIIFDSQRSTSATDFDNFLYPNLPDAEVPNVDAITTTSTGFIVTRDNAAPNFSGGTYIYLAIA